MRPEAKWCAVIAVLYAGWGPCEIGRADSVPKIEWQQLSSNTADFSADLNAAYQALVDRMDRNQASGGTILIPYRSAPYQIQADPASTSICTPKIGLRIFRDHITVAGVPDAVTGALPTIQMTGLSPKDVNQQSDIGGVDYFTVFSFNAVTGGGVNHLNFVGDNDGTVVHRYYGARAKAIAINGSRNISISYIKGYGILGNLVNVRPYSSNERIKSSGKPNDPTNCRSKFGASYSDPIAEAAIAQYNKTYQRTNTSLYLLSLDVSVDHVEAAMSFEDGIDFMGSTGRTTLSNALLWGNDSAGVETGSRAGLQWNGLWKNQIAGVNRSSSSSQDFGSQLFNVVSYGNGYSGVSLDGDNTTLKTDNCSRIFANGTASRVVSWKMDPAVCDRNPRSCVLGPNGCDGCCGETYSKNPDGSVQQVSLPNENWDGTACVRKSSAGYGIVLGATTTAPISTTSLPGAPSGSISISGYEVRGNSNLGLYEIGCYECAVDSSQIWLNSSGPVVAFANSEIYAKVTADDSWKLGLNQIQVQKDSPRVSLTGVVNSTFNGTDLNLVMQNPIGNARALTAVSLEGQAHDGSGASVSYQAFGYINTYEPTTHSLHLKITAFRPIGVQPVSGLVTLGTDATRAVVNPSSVLMTPAGTVVPSY